MNPTTRDCPQCNVTLTRYDWSRLWWVSAGMSGRLVVPCSECGALLRLSSMRLITSLGALGLLASSVALIVHRSDAVLFLALLCSTLMLVGVLLTRVEAVMRTAIDVSVPRPLPARRSASLEESRSRRPGSPPS